jgi:hypothetical protein
VAETNDNPVLIAVLAAAFIGERMTLRRTIGLLMAGRREGRPGIIWATEPADLDDAPAGGASTKTSIPRKRTWWALPSVSRITA